MSQVQLWNLSESGLWHVAAVVKFSFSLISHVSQAKPPFLTQFPGCSSQPPVPASCSSGCAASKQSVLSSVAGAPLRDVGVPPSGCWQCRGAGLGCGSAVLGCSRVGRVGLAGCALPPFIPALPYHSLFGWRGAPLLRPPPHGKCVLTLGLNTLALTNVPLISSRASSPRRAPQVAGLSKGNCLLLPRAILQSSCHCSDGKGHFSSLFPFLCLAPSLRCHLSLRECRFKCRDLPASLYLALLQF